MAMFDVKIDGFEELQLIAKRLSTLDESVFKKEATKAAHDFGELLYAQIMEWMNSGRPDWPSLSDATVMLRSLRDEKDTPKSGENVLGKGSPQPLVDSGSFKRAIQLEKDDSGSALGILVPRDESGKDIQMIAEIMEGGALIPVTDKMRNYLATKGIHLRKTTRVISVPKRPLFNPAADLLDENLAEWLKPYEDNILREIGLEEL